MRQAEGRWPDANVFSAPHAYFYIGAVPLWAPKATPAPGLREALRGSTGDTHAIVISLPFLGKIWCFAGVPKLGAVVCSSPRAHLPRSIVWLPVVGVCNAVHQSPGPMLRMVAVEGF